MSNTIYVGDTFPIQVSWFIPSADNPYVSSDAIISRATVRVLHNKSRKMIVNNEEATISGNETTYILPSELNRTKGSHTALMTAEFNDGNILTQEVAFYVRG